MVQKIETHKSLRRDKNWYTKVVKEGFDLLQKWLSLANANHVHVQQPGIDVIFCIGEQLD